MLAAVLASNAAASSCEVEVWGGAPEKLVFLDCFHWEHAVADLVVWAHLCWEGGAWE